MYLIALVSSVGLVSPVGSTPTNPATSHHTLRDFPRNSWRRLRLSTGVKEDEDTYESRAFDLSGVKVHINSWLQRLKNFAQRIKLKFSSNNPHTTDKLFTHYKVGQVSVESNLLESTQFQKWFNSMTKTYKKNSDAGDVVMAAKLISHYGDDAVAKMLIAASDVQRTENIAARLEKALFTTWRSTTNNADDVFKLLKLNDEGDQLLKSPVWDMWFSYFTQVYRSNSDEVLLQVLKNHYADDAIAKMVGVAKSRKMAEPLKGALFSSWLSLSYDADDVFKILKLNNQGDKVVFENPVFPTWMSYLPKLKLTNQDEVMFTVLKTHYGESELMKLVEMAKSGRKKIWGGIAAKVEQELWRSQGKTSDDIFTLFKLGQKDNSLLESPEFASWMAYATKLEKLSTKPDPFAVISQLQRSYSDLSLAQMISLSLKKTTGAKWIRIKLVQEEQFGKWLNQYGNVNGVKIMLSRRDVARSNDPVLLDFLSFIAKSTT
ncbi:RxLR effector protein [Phytophthora megakarya]|uniref:RxLR effector protein n=1 Tax=Phytophthora megakarya TaxID=4795 RepID=A0A225WHH1_9STRA|nr:RxLR effector protein [Phytophthora megakarya]